MEIYDKQTFIFLILGENNAGYNRDKYNCTFAKMIEAWRNVWHTRTQSITDPNFPFGFVQVKKFFLMNRSITVFLSSYQRLMQQVRESEASHGFVGIKHLMLVLYQIMLYQMYSWQWL